MAREWTEEQKQAARERLAAARQKKQDIIAAKTRKAEDTYIEAVEKANVVAQQVKANQEESPEANEPTQTQDPDVAQLTKMVLELKQQLDDAKQNAPQMDILQALQAMNKQNTTVNREVKEKYNTDLKSYPDPTTRLREETRLKRIAFDTNYELGWETKVTRYQTAQGDWQKEPQFQLTLNQVVLDDDGEPTNRRIGKAKLIFFEDPDTAVVVAQRNGLDIDESNEPEFLNEMRYLQARDWLFECFWPAKQTGENSKQQIVIGGQVVDTWEIAVPEGTGVKIPFGDLGKFKS